MSEIPIYPLVRKARALHIQRETMDACYRISSMKIAHQNIDGEIIVIHYETGNYYSLSGSGARLWEMLERPQSVEALAARFENGRDRAERAVTTFVEKLLGEGLIERTHEAAMPVANGELIPFAPPVLERYSDLQQLLLADPIHDVEEQGWPKVKARG